MPTQWKYIRDGREHGPVSSGQLKQMAASGQLAPDDLIWKEGLKEWLPANRLQGLSFGKATPVRPPIADQPPPRPPSAKPPRPTEPVPSHADAVEPIIVPSVDVTTDSSSASSRMRSKSSEIFSSFTATAKSAGQLVAKQAERTRLTQATLPHAYKDLGQHVYSEEVFRQELQDAYSKIESLQADLQALESHDDAPTAEGMAARAKALGKKGKDAAHAKAVQLKLSQAYGSIGKSAFDAYGEDAGPAERVRPIADALDRVAKLDSEIEELSQASSGQLITPKRLAVGGVGACGVAVLLIALSIVGGGGNNHRGPSRSGELSSPSGSDSYQLGYQLAQQLAERQLQDFQNLPPAAKAKLRSYYKDQLSGFERNRDDLIRVHGSDLPAAQEKMGFVDGYQAVLRANGI